MRALLALLPLVLLAACHRPEPPAGTPAPDTAAAAPTVDPAHLEIQGYLLTEDRLDRFFAASGAVVAAMNAATPEERERIGSTISPDDPSEEADDASLDEFAHRLQTNAAVRGAAEGAGLSAREYAVLTLVLIRAGTVEAIANAQPTEDPAAIARSYGVDPANVAFMRDHAADIARRQEALEAEMGFGEE